MKWLNEKLISDLLNFMIFDFLNFKILYYFLWILYNILPWEINFHV